MFSLSEQTRSGKTNLAENIRKHIDHIGDLVLDRFCARVTRKILEKGLGKTKLSTKWQWVCFGSWPSQNKAYANISSLDQFLLKNDPARPFRPEMVLAGPTRREMVLAGPIFREIGPFAGRSVHKTKTVRNGLCTLIWHSFASCLHFFLAEWSGQDHYPANLSSQDHFKDSRIMFCGSGSTNLCFFFCCHSWAIGGARDDFMENWWSCQSKFCQKLSCSMSTPCV